MTTVLVGTKDPPNVIAALQWAFEYARTNHASLRVKHIWRYPLCRERSGAMMAPPPQPFEEVARAALDDAMKGLDTCDVVVEKCVRAGHGGFAGLVLGSVATHCTRHAKVPTVVIPNAISGDAQ